MINNVSLGNEWHLQDTDDKSVHYGKKFMFCFDQFKAEKIRMLIKSYVWQNYHTGSITLSTIYRYYIGFKKFNVFASQNGIESLADFNADDADNFMTFLRLYISNRTKEPLTYFSQKGIFTALRAVVYWGQIFAPELVPAKEVFNDSKYPYRTKNKTEYIPDDVVRQINAALSIEENPYLKYGIIILLSTGMRLSEFINLKVGCVSPHLLSGDTLTLYDFKNRHQCRKLPINPICADAITKLEEITTEFREKADEHIKNFLFLYETTKFFRQRHIKTVSARTFCEWINGYTQRGVYYPGFMNRHKITGSDGEIYHLKSQQFRKTVATDMFSKNVDLKVIQGFLRHMNPHTTKRYYADSKDIDRAMIFEKVGIIGNINNVDTTIIANEDELVWFKENKDKGAKMCDGYCTMPIADGKICERLTKHQKCYTCSRYITTPEYLQEHKMHLAELETQLANNIYGTHFAAHISPSISVLKDIIKRLEAIKNES